MAAEMDQSPASSAAGITALQGLKRTVLKNLTIIESHETKQTSKVGCQHS